MRNPFRRAKQKKNQDAVQEEKRTVAEGPTTGGDADADGIEGRLVVMGNESTFSDEVVEYAIDMARRMSFEILALNSAPLSCDRFSLLSTAQSRLCREFRSLSEKNAQTFQQAAETVGVPFVHVVKFDEPDEALASVQREFKNIEFVISDDQPQAAADQVAESRRPHNEVLVYAMI